MLDQILFDSPAECPAVHAGNAVSFLNKQDVSKSLKWELMLIELTACLLCKACRMLSNIFALPSLPFRILVVQGSSQIPLLP